MSIIELSVDEEDEDSEVETVYEDPADEAIESTAAENPEAGDAEINEELIQINEEPVPIVDETPVAAAAVPDLAQEFAEFKTQVNEQFTSINFAIHLILKKLG